MPIHTHTFAFVGTSSIAYNLSYDDRSRVTTHLLNIEHFFMIASQIPHTHTGEGKSVEQRKRANKNINITTEAGAFK